ncbi:DNA polymerase delta subunit 2 [Thelohanellus kitauei]|uniref:DNA polymerase delta subunit 2 n=1 Tax=Thelohanellus kitauei TaxID=669202 RepID=A0A0C2N3J3_THEKT|nr:DNA polymerase delta subunit 2 [Thelohanellus kitauei]
MSGTTSCVVISNNFLVSRSEICGQYNKLYINRLNRLRPRLHERVKDVWGMESKNLSKLAEGEREAIVGVLYKHMKLQHTALKEIEQKLKMESIEYLENYTSEDDHVYIDDEYQRLELLNFPDVQEVVSELLFYTPITVETIILILIETGAPDILQH